jgi:hypothetical protein
MRRLKIIHTTAFVLVFGLMGPLTVGQDKPDKQEEKPKAGNQTTSPIQNAKSR